MFKLIFNQPWTTQNLGNVNVQSYYASTRERQNQNYALLGYQMSTSLKPVPLDRVKQNFCWLLLKPTRSEAWPEPSQLSKMKSFESIANGF